MYLQDILNNRIVQLVTVFLLAVIFVFTLFSGIKSGRSKAESQTVYANTESIIQSLDYFYQDQERYPTAMEFSEPGIMGWYLSQFPVEDIISGDCLSSFRYFRPNSQKYELNFCLSQDYKSFKSGWNKFLSAR